MAYFDIQVNGYGGVDFNQNDLAADDLHRCCQQLLADGVGGILATVITEAPETMIARIKRLCVLREADKQVREMIVGLHVEGPFISLKDGYRGAHPAEAIQAADDHLAARLLEAGDGLVRIFTLAPEQDRGNRVTRRLSEAGVVVSAGHTDASLDQLKSAIDAGLSMFTHLGNGCPQELPRHDNIIQRAFYLREHLWLSFIADGIHIPFPALRNYLELAGDRALVTTDAIAAAGLGPGIFRISRWTVEVKEDLAAWAPDGTHLLGSAIAMSAAVENLSRHVGLASDLINALTDLRPRQATGLSS